MRIRLKGNSVYCGFILYTIENIFTIVETIELR